MPHWIGDCWEDALRKPVQRVVGQRNRMTSPCDALEDVTTSVVESAVDSAVGCGFLNSSTGGIIRPFRGKRVDSIPVRPRPASNTVGETFGVIERRDPK